MGRFDGRRLSWLRLCVLVGGACALVVASLSGWKWSQDAKIAASSGFWFAAYADVPVTPRLQFEDPTSPAARNVVLSFVVAAPDSACQPSWGRDYSLNDASTDLDLDRRIARLRQNKGDVAVSFGGAVNRELATACTDPKKLLAAYREVVERYDVDVVDFDIEGDALNDEAANQRRAEAIKALQDERALKDQELQVWLTLPVSPHGLSEESQRIVTTTLNAQVELAGINVMTMNYATSRPASQSMAGASIAALNATHDQLETIYARSGRTLGSATLWTRMGATPMIGQNDVRGEVFTIDDAKQLNAFAHDKGLGRLSMWSLNRDRTCGPNYPDTQVVSNSCSGIDQQSLRFADVLRKGLSGNRVDKPSESPVPARGEHDDPATSPYPIWNKDEVYVEATRVVWRRNVYMAKWWTTGDVPNDPTVDEFSSPWQLIGPVLPGEKPVVIPTLPAGTYPDWESDRIYTKGQRVLFEGVAFEAKWWTQHDVPTARSTQADPGPWARLSDTDLRKAAAARR